MRIGISWGIIIRHGKLLDANTNKNGMDATDVISAKTKKSLLSHVTNAANQDQPLIQTLKFGDLYLPLPTDIVQEVFEYALPITKRNFVCVNKLFQANDILGQDIYPIGNRFEIRFENLKNLFYTLESKSSFVNRKRIVDMLTYYQSIPAIKQFPSLVAAIEKRKKCDPSK